MSTIIAIVAAVLGAGVGVFGLIFGFKEKSKRESAEEDLAAYTTLKEAQEENTMEAIKEVNEEIQEIDDATESEKREVIDNYSSPASDADRLERLRE